MDAISSEVVKIVGIIVASAAVAYVLFVKKKKTDINFNTRDYCCPPATYRKNKAQRTGC
jgi:hypothetical protein